MSNDGRRIRDRVGVSVACTWEEFEQLTSHARESVWKRLPRVAVKVLGKVRGNIALGELARGRTPRLVPSRRA